MATATKDKVETKAGKGYVLCAPEDVTLMQCRYFDHSEDGIMSMVSSYENDGGQLVPVSARKTKDGYEVFAGNLRVKAARKFNELYPSKPMQLKMIVTNDNADDAYIKAIKDNDERHPQSVVDRVFQMKHLREEKGWNDKEIADYFDVQQSFVSRAKKITGLRKHILEMMHSGDLKFDAAVMLADLSDEDQDDVLKWAEESKKKKDEEYEAALKTFIESGGNRLPADQGDDDIPADFGGEDHGSNGASTPARTNRAQTPGTPKTTTFNQEVQGAVRKKRTANVEGGKDDKLTPPTLARVKEVLKEEFGTKSCPDRMHIFAANALNWLTGKDKMTDAKFIKACKELFSDGWTVPPAETPKPARKK